MYMLSNISSLCWGNYATSHEIKGVLELSLLVRCLKNIQWQFFSMKQFNLQTLNYMSTSQCFWCVWIWDRFQYWGIYNEFAVVWSRLQSQAIGLFFRQIYHGDNEDNITACDKILIHSESNTRALGCKLWNSMNININMRCLEWMCNCMGLSALFNKSMWSIGRAIQI